VITSTVKGFATKEKQLSDFSLLFLACSVDGPESDKNCSYLYSVGFSKKNRLPAKLRNNVLLK